MCVCVIKRMRNKKGYSITKVYKKFHTRQLFSQDSSPNEENSTQVKTYTEKSPHIKTSTQRKAYLEKILHRKKTTMSEQ